MSVGVVVDIDDDEDSNDAAVEFGAVVLVVIEKCDDGGRATEDKPRTRWRSKEHPE